uniref:ATP synthase CF1 delta subunit n=1 Tax=Rhodospora sordida TaxID=362230 RepID=UPI001FCE27B8|nr:ATP synthase CF1 delta subunit [Rhodospora sordida]UNJ15031.1 ATP synthase CF1 delta subunit [Rhodospora sordida]
MISRAITDKIAQPYAEALLEISSNNSNISSVTEEVKLISSTLANSQDLKSLFVNPVVSSKLKKDLLDKIFSQKITQSTLNFLKILADRRRLYILDSIIEKYLEFAYEVANITLAKVIASVALSNGQQELLIEKIKLMTESSKVELLTQVDPNLIGGLTIQIGSQVIDTSLQGQIKQMASHLDINL